MSKTPSIINACPICGAQQFLISKGIYFCAPDFIEARGCGWSGPRDKLHRIGKTKRDQRQLDFEKQYVWHDGSPAWCLFWRFWWNNAHRDIDIPRSDIDHGIQIAIAEGKLRRRD